MHLEPFAGRQRGRQVVCSSGYVCSLRLCSTASDRSILSAEHATISVKVTHRVRPFIAADANRILFHGHMAAADQDARLQARADEGWLAHEASHHAKTWACYDELCLRPVSQ